MDLSNNKLGLLPGQLSKNTNYFHMDNGGLEERGGGAKLSNAPSAGNPIYSLVNYIYSDGSEWHLINQGTDVYYYSSGWNALSLSLTTSLKTRWAHAGSGTSRAIYGVNGTDGVIKVVESGGVPTGSSVGSSPTDMVDIINHKGRLFGHDGKDTLKYTDALAYETWDTVNNKQDIFAGRDGRLQKLEVWGDALFIFKEYAVYVLPNADEADSAWLFLRTDAETGTQSPDSVRRTKDGIYFLGSDNRVRKIAPDISFSNSNFTLGGSGTPVISHPIQDAINDNIDNSNKDNAFAYVFQDRYFLSFESSAGSANDTIYHADTTKQFIMPGIPTPQPYWGEITGPDMQFMSTQKVTGEVLFYFANSSSDVHECLIPDTNNDDGSAISSVMHLGFMDFGGPGVYKKFKKVRMVADVEDHALSCIFKAYKKGPIPGDGEGLSKTFDPVNDAAEVVGTAVVGTAVVGYKGIISEDFNITIKGYYFGCEISNTNADEFTRINSLTVYFRPIKSS